MGPSIARNRHFSFGILALIIALHFCSCLRDGPLLGIHQPSPLSDFPPIERIWEGGNFTYLGSGIYYKKILFISVRVSEHVPRMRCHVLGVWSSYMLSQWACTLQVYAAALYVEAEPATKELQRLQDEGFFEKEGYSTDRLTGALAAGRFRRACNKFYFFNKILFRVLAFQKWWRDSSML